MLDDKLLSQLSTKSVLCVDKDADLQHSLNSVLSLFFGSVHCAKDGISAFDLYKTHKFDLIITSLHLPRLDGLSLIKKIREQDANIAILVLSECQDISVLLECIELHLLRFMPKPLDEQKLFDALALFAQFKQNQERVMLSNSWILIPKQNILLIDSSPVSLSTKECKFLSLFTQKDEVVTYANIAKKCWNKSSFSSNAMRLMVKNLRKKLPSSSLKNHTNLGYFL